MKIKGAIFDMDGTLVDSLFFWDDYWSELGIRYFGDKTFYPHADVEKLLRTMTLEQMVRRIQDIYSMEASVIHRMTCPASSMRITSEVALMFWVT